MIAILKNVLLGSSLGKRLLIMAALVFLGLFIARAPITNAIYESPIPDSLKLSTYDYKMAKDLAMLKGDNNWKPVGYGDGQWLTDLPKINAGAVMDFDSGKVIWSMNLKSKIAPASLTKLATVMTALDLESSDKVINVSENASNQVPTIIGLKQNEKITIEEAVAASIMTSANDAAQAIADSVGNDLGGSKNFMALVNEKSKKIGVENTNFTNATGLDDQNHYSTVYDLALLAHFAKSNYPLIANLATQDYKRLGANANHKQYDLPNWNALLGTYPGVDGLKIGYTENAGYVTIVTANQDGHKIMAIVVGADSIENREKAAAVLLNKGFTQEGAIAYPIDNLDLLKKFEDWRRELTQVAIDSPI